MGMFSKDRLPFQSRVVIHVYHSVSRVWMQQEYMLWRHLTYCSPSRSFLGSTNFTIIFSMGARFVIPPFPKPSTQAITPEDSFMFSLQP